MTKLPDTQVPIRSVLAERWSPRSFESKPLPQTDLVAILEAGRWAPSSYNEQPWRFLVTQAGEAAYDKLFDTLGEWNQEWVKGTPVLMMSMCSNKYRKNEKPNRHAPYDTGMAVMSMVIEAQGRGIYSHQMGGYDPDKVRESFELPDHVDSYAAIAMGYQGDPTALPTEDFRKMEVAPRDRLALAETCFGERFGVPTGIISL